MWSTNLPARCGRHRRASGIGAGVIEKFLAEGAKVVNADIDAGKGAALAEQHGAHALCRRTDPAETDQVSELLLFACSNSAGSTS
jgi:NAD(P)-dependent dehydrogenase (short-subunit alcohol dehydrogenase family)